MPDEEFAKELEALRKHCEEAKNDPDYAIFVWHSEMGGRSLPDE